MKIEKGLFGEWAVEKEKLLRRCRLIISYNKRYYSWEKKEEWLMNVIHTFEEIYRRASRNLALRHQDFSIVGIDFTGSDRMARPEAYAPLIRYARAKNPKPFRQFTYHAGEDFFDLMDGLRTIDEILTLLQWDRHCRLGHCLALGMTPAVYYESRGWNVIAPRQVLLDSTSTMSEREAPSEETSLLSTILPLAGIKVRFSRSTYALSIFRDIEYNESFLPATSCE